MKKYTIILISIIGMMLGGCSNEKRSTCEVLLEQRQYEMHSNNSVHISDIDILINKYCTDTIKLTKWTH